MSGLSDFRRIVESDWLECRGRSGRWASTLHHADLDDSQIDVEAWLVSSIHVVSCGRLMRFSYIPSIGARMESPRCSQCCRALGYPPGRGSPKNDPKCMDILAQHLVPPKRIRPPRLKYPHCTFGHGYISHDHAFVPGGMPEQNTGLRTCRACGLPYSTPTSSHGGFVL